MSMKVKKRGYYWADGNLVEKQNNINVELYQGAESQNKYYQSPVSVGQTVMSILCLRIKQ